MVAPMPGTMPPKPKRKPFDLSQLSPEMQQQIMTSGQLTFEDGSTVYADGSMTGAGDSPDDFAVYGMPAEGTLNTSFGGYGEETPGTMPAEPRNPLGGPLFRRYRQTANAGMPGQTQDDATDNPMDEPFPNPFETPAPARTVTVPGGASVTASGPRAASTPAGEYTQADDPTKKSGNTYGGRFGRRQLSRTNSRTMPPRRRR